MAKCSGIGPTDYDRSQLQVRSSEALCMCATSLNHIHLCRPFVHVRMVDCVVVSLLCYSTRPLPCPAVRVDVKLIPKNKTIYNTIVGLFLIYCAHFLPYKGIMNANSRNLICWILSMQTPFSHGWSHICTLYIATSPTSVCTFTEPHTWVSWLPGVQSYWIIPKVNQVNIELSVVEYWPNRLWQKPIASQVKWSPLHVCSLIESYTSPWVICEHKVGFVSDSLPFRSSDKLDHIFLEQGLSTCFATIQGFFLVQPWELM